MFIEITTPQNPLRLENTLRPYKRGEQPFTPKQPKNPRINHHKKNIYDTLQIIANLPKEQQAQYKNIILSTFDHREQPTDTILLGKKLAVANGFEDELNAILTHDPMQDTTNGILYASAPNKIAAYIITDRTIYPSNYPENIHLICANDEVNLLDTNFSTVKSLKFKDGAEVYLYNCQNLPETLDLSMCDNVDLSYTNLSTIKSLRFKEGAEVRLAHCKNLPADLDVSMCNAIYLNDTDLSNVKSLRFKEGTEVDLSYCENLPETLDLSMCDNVDLSYTDLSAIKSFRFKDGATVNLSYCENLPADLDVSMCDQIYLNDTDLSAIKSFRFKDGATVNLSYCENLPADLDVSMCDQIYLNDTDLSTVKTQKFKNKQQLNESSVKIPENWQGKITYTDEQSPVYPKLKKIFTR